MIIRFVIECVDFGVFTILIDADQEFTLSVTYLLASRFGIKISRASFLNTLSAVH